MPHQTALVTGASAGLGRAIAQALSKAGYQLILLARRADKLEALAQQLATPCHVFAADLSDHRTVKAGLEALPEKFQSIDVLVNNAGLALGITTSDQTEWDEWQTMIDTNVTALAFLTRQILPGMVARNQGHILNMGSTAGHYAYKGSNMYGATKAFVDHFSISLRADLVGTKVRVTNLIPGLISETEFSNVRLHDDKAAIEALYANCQPLLPSDIADAVAWVLAQPERVNINRLEIMPTCQAPAGLVVHKE